MHDAQKAKPLSFKLIDWKIILLVCVALFYLTLIGNDVLNDTKSPRYRGDYLAFWSVGKIADQEGYSKIYNLRYLQNIQLTGLNTLGLEEVIDSVSNPTIPVPYFSFFVIPFQLLSKISVISGYWIWNISNLVILIGYLLFFFKNTKIPNEDKHPNAYLLSILILSYPVFINFWLAQVNVFMVICVGEFIREAIKQKPVISGFWLGGLLLKPQSLLLIIPFFILMRHWKVLFGFIVSSVIILASSLLLSGVSGMDALMDLWTKYSAGMASNTLQAMINWRMVGINLNTFTNTTIGWVIAIIGMTITLLSVFYVAISKTDFGSPRWILTVFGVFSATIAVTWHSHYHMTMILIPFLIYGSWRQLIPTKISFFWAIGAPMLVLAVMIANIAFVLIQKNESLAIDALTSTGIAGFLLNLLVLYSVIKALSSQKMNEKNVNN